MKITRNIAVFCAICLTIAGCRKYNDDYKVFLSDHEVTYPGLASNTHYNTGNLRAQLVWNPSPDPNIARYTISWNNGADSLKVDATTHDPKDTVKTIIPALRESVYTFKVVAYDIKGNMSVGQNINNVRVYGGVYSATLLNRTYDVVNPYELQNDGSVKVNFIKADSTNVSTTVRYTDNTGAVKERHLKKKDNSVTLPNYKVGSLIRYQSYYVPEQTSIDSFAVPEFDNLPILADKSKFQPLHLPSDISSAYGWELPNLWDNNLNEPGFHTPGQTLPFWISFDMGAPSSLIGLKVYQRMSAVYDAGNAKRFEVWGSNSPNPDGTYDSWTKLGTCVSVKPSGLPGTQKNDADIAFQKAGEYFALPAGTPDVRYIRIKILETWSGSNYFHAIELNFYKQNK